MVERVIETEVPVYGNSQTVVRRKIGIAHGVLRAAGCWHAEFCWPPRPCTSCRRRAKHAHRGWCLTLGCWTHVAPLLVLRSLAGHGTARGRSLHEVGSDEERGEVDTQAIDGRFEGLIEHIPHHDHAPWHPLPPPTQFPVVELGHRAMAAHQGGEQGQHRFRTDTIALGEFRDFLLSFRRQLLHTGDPLHSESIV